MYNMYYTAKANVVYFRKIIMGYPQTNTVLQGIQNLLCVSAAILDSSIYLGITGASF